MLVCRSFVSAILNKYSIISIMNKDIIFYIIQIVSIYNAILLGWKVRKIGNNKYELTKSNHNMESFCLKTFIKNITTVNLESSAVV